MTPPADAPDPRPLRVAAPGTRVVLNGRANPRHFRRGLVGVVRESSVHQDPAPRTRFDEPSRPAPPPRGWLVVDFPTCPRNGRLPFGSFFWADEVDVTGTPENGA